MTVAGELSTFYIALCQGRYLAKRQERQREKTERYYNLALCEYVL